MSLTSTLNFFVASENLSSAAIKSSADNFDVLGSEKNGPSASRAVFTGSYLLNQDALVILASRFRRNPRFVFTYQGKRILQTSTAAWYKALRRSRIEDFRWHDLRHTWASWHVQSGTPLHVLQELGGWRSYDMVLRYAHFSADHLARYAGNLGRLTQFVAAKERRSSF